MPIRNGQKFACESCIRGHRVSACTHTDRELKLIPPKGRPVKQCDHCRMARKSKSHHGKCDCGSKKEKKDKDEDKTEVAKVLTVDAGGCCCHVGESCVCGKKNDDIETRMERSLKRHSLPVKAKPPLSSCHSESKLTVFTNGHHKPVHRNNNLAHTSGMPYQIPRPKSSRPHTLHGASAFASTVEDREFLDSLDSTPRAADDLSLSQSPNNYFSVPPTINRTNSDQTHVASSVDSNEGFCFDFDKHFATRARSSDGNIDGLQTLNEEGEGLAQSWYETAGTSMSGGGFNGIAYPTASPNFTEDSVFPMTTIPAVPSNQYFSPNDLPLLSQFEFVQPVSQSGDSAHLSIPGMTNTSSAAHDDDMKEQQLSWPDSLQAGQSIPQGWEDVDVSRPLDNILDAAAAQNMGHFIAGPSEVDLAKGLQHQQFQQQRHFSTSSAVTAYNLGTSLGGQSETDSGAIVIPAGDESANDATADQDWGWEGDFSMISPVNVSPGNAELSRQYSWLS